MDKLPGLALWQLNGMVIGMESLTVTYALAGGLVGFFALILYCCEYG